MVSIDRHLETIGKYEQKCTKVLKSQRKFKLVKRRELIPPVAMKFFHSLKWVSIGSKSTNTKNINKTSNIFVNCTENIEIVQHIGVQLVLNPKTILLKLKFK